MPTVIPINDAGWTDLGPTPLTIELIGTQFVAYLVSASIPANVLSTSRTMGPDEAIFIGGGGRRVYARTTTPFLSQASVSVGSLAEFLGSPPPVNLRDPASRSALLAIVDPATGQARGETIKSYALLSAATATGAAASGIRGGDYIWRVEGTFGAGVTATLQSLGLDGVTWKTVRNAANSGDVALTGEGQVGIGIGQGATMRVLITGTQTTALNSTLAGLS